MRNFILLALLSTVAQPLFAVSMNFGGSFRTEADLYGNLDLGSKVAPDTKNFLSTRALLDPNLIIDDHFSIHSQWNLLTSPRFTPNAVNSLSSGQGGYIMGDPSSNALILTRAWLEWTSDFGVMRIGRMPVSWGYGLVYDEGDEIWDNWTTVFDRIEYRLHLGHLVGAIAYSKLGKISVLGQQGDEDYYTVYLQYNNPEVELDAGIMYEKQVRASTLGGYLTGSGPGNPFSIPVVNNQFNQPPLAQSTFFPLSNSLVDLYAKKTSGGFSIGGEVAWISGSAVPSGDLNAFAMTANTAYEFGKVKTYLDILYASGDGAPGAHFNGFALLHRNRSPGLILGRELLGQYASNTVGYGSPLYYGQAGTFSGIYYFRPGVRVDWSSALATGLELIIPRKAVTAQGDSASLGTELDLNVTHSVYKNFDVGVDLGYLFAGNGLGVANPSGVYAARATVATKF